MLLLLKLTLAPSLVAVATLVARRWGPRAGGILIGFPLSTGPIFIFLAIEHGLDFAQKATVGILFGLVGVATFALAYAVVSRRTGWIGSLVVAVMGFFAVSAVVSQIEAQAVGAGLAAYTALLLVALMVRPPRSNPVRGRPPRWDLPLRMAAAAILTLTITEAANSLGPVLSGIIGTYPVVTTVVVAFTHHQWGRAAAVGMLRGSVLSWISFASCFLAIGLTLEVIGLAPSLILGTACAAATSVVVLWLDKRSAARACPDA